jgi:adenylate cyclase class 2
MKVEIEAKWVGVDFGDVREKLKELGAEMAYPERMMIRTVFSSFGDRAGEYARVRDEGNKVVMTYKRVSENSAVGMREVNVVIDSYEKGVEFLREVGLRVKSIEETKRELWRYKGAEITLDTWPWVPEFVEIEAGSEIELEGIAEELGLKMTEAMYTSADLVYARFYDVTPEEINAHGGGWGEIRFGDGRVPEWLEKRRRD